MGRHRAALSIPEMAESRKDSCCEATNASGYDFNAIRHLYCEAAMREAGTQEFYDKLGIVPLTVVYEDFVADFEATVAKVLDHLGLLAPGTQIAPPFFDKLADDLSDTWAIRFKNELQADWQNKGW